jgi:hypothetical protein
MACQDDPISGLVQIWSVIAFLAAVWAVPIKKKMITTFTNRSNGYSEAKFRSPELNDTRSFITLQYVLLRPLGP